MEEEREAKEDWNTEKKKRSEEAKAIYTVCGTLASLLAALGLCSL